MPALQKLNSVIEMEKWAYAVAKLTESWNFGASKGSNPCADKPHVEFDFATKVAIFYKNRQTSLNTDKR